MPKNNPTPNTPRPPRPPSDGIGVGNSPPDVLPLLISLVDLNAAILSELQPGTPTVLRDDGPRLRVFTPLGTYVGAVSEHDVGQLKEVKIRGTRVFSVTTQPPQVLIEVRV